LKYVLLALLALFISSGAGHAAPNTVIRESVAVCDPNNPTLCYAPGYSYNNITTKTNTVVKSSAGTLVQVDINAPGTSDTLTIYDNTTCTGTKIGTITVPSSGTVFFPFNVKFGTGLCITSGGGAAGDYTVVYQ